MAEFNPYKLEEEKWTPKNVYEILPPNSVSWSDYDFGQGTDNVDRDAAEKSFIDGFVEFFSDLFDTAGQILGGAIGLGGKVLEGFVNGVSKLIGGVANALGSIFGGPTESPYPPMFSPIKVNLEAAIQPFKDQIEESKQNSEDLLAEQLDIRGQIAEQVEITKSAVADAKAASESAGEAIERAEAASAAAREARETLEEYNTALTEQIREEFNAAVGRAETAIEKAEAANSELITMNTQLGEITQQASDINDRLEEHNQRFTDGLETANSAIEEAKDLTAAVKALAEENQAKVDSAVSKAEKASSDLAALSPQVADAVDKANKASSDVSAMTSQVSEAAGKASEAYAEVGKFTSKIEEAQTKGESALAVADKAVDWLKNPVEIGTSIIAVDPETKRPYYAIRMELVDDNPPGTSGPTYMSPASVSTPGVPGPHVPVDPKIKYTVSFWAKANKAGSIIYGQFRTQEELNLAPDGSPMSVGAINISAPPQPSNKDADGNYVHGAAANSYFIQDLELQTKWTYYEHEIQFAEGVTSVRISGMYWSHSRGVAADQYISGLDIRPQIPTQASVDQAQNDAIRANTEILRQQGEINEAQRVANLAQDKLNEKQGEWNKAVDRSLATQETVNDNFKKWSDGAVAAIEANTTAIALLNNPQAGASLVVTDPTTKRPNWAEKLVEATAAENPDNLPDAYKAVPGTGSNFAKNMFVNIDPTTEYIVSLWVKANKTGSNMTYDMRDQDGNLAFAKSRAVEGFLNAGDNYRPYWIKNVPTKWTQYKAIVTPRETARQVRFGTPYFNHSAGTTTNATQFVADFQIYPLVPSQAQVDDAQNKAIQANRDLLVEQDRINKEQEKLNKLREDFEVEQKKINNEQTGINALNAATDNALLQGLKALGKKSLGISLVPYQTPSDQEVEDYVEGKLKYDPWSRPEYFAAGHAVLETTQKGYAPTANDNQGQVSFQGTPVKVDPSISYKVKFDTYAGRAGSRLFWYTYNQNNENCLAYTPFADTANTGGRGLIHGLTIPSGWKTWEGVITFTPETEEVKLWTLFWNHPSGVSSRQYITNLEIVPDIPDANVVNMLQDQAILENTQVGKDNKKAIDALTEGLEAYAAAADLERLHKDIGDELEKEQDARAELAAEINDLLVESIPRTIVYNSGPQYNDHISADRDKVTAKGTWVGQMLLDVTYVSKSDGSQTKRVIQNLTVPDPDGKREYSIPSASFGGYIPAYRLDYWIYRGKSVQKALSNSGSYITGSSFTKNTWTRIATHTIGKSNGAVHILWRTRLTRADRGVTYSFDVRVNGKSVLTKNYKGYGPLTSFGSGVASLSFSGNLSVPDNGKVEVYAKANGTANQASVSSNKGTLTYLELEK